MAMEGPDKEPCQLSSPLGHRRPGKEEDNFQPWDGEEEVGSGLGEEEGEEEGGVEVTCVSPAGSLQDEGDFDPLSCLADSRSETSDGVTTPGLFSSSSSVSSSSCSSSHLPGTRNGVSLVQPEPGPARPVRYSVHLDLRREDEGLWGLALEEVGGGGLRRKS